MIHPDEGRLRALLDDELTGAESAEVRAHVSGCAGCATALHDVEQTGLRITSLCAVLDAPAPTERVRARLAERRAARAAADVVALPTRRRWVGRSDLARAATMVLLFSGAVAAAVHPASPLRRWLAGAAEETVRVAPTEGPAAAAPAIAPREVGVRVLVAGGGARVALTGALPGTAIEVTWVDQGAAAVYAPEGTAFRTSDGEGRIDATLSAGPVRVELPRGAPSAALRVDGRVYLEKTGERIDYPGPAALVEGARVRFEVR